MLIAGIVVAAILAALVVIYLRRAPECTCGDERCGGGCRLRSDRWMADY